MLHQYACCISTVVHGISKTRKVLQSQILPDSILDFAKDIVIDVSSSDDTDIQ